MNDELIRKSDVLNLLNKTKVALWHDNYAGAVLIAIHDAVEDMQPVNAVELPCKIEDKIFEVCKQRYKIYERTVKGFSISDKVELICCETKNFSIREIGDTAFFTREEAEKALEDLKSD